MGGAGVGDFYQSSSIDIAKSRRQRFFDRDASRGTQGRPSERATRWLQRRLGDEKKSRGQDDEKQKGSSLFYLLHEAVFCFFKFLLLRFFLLEGKKKKHERGHASLKKLDRIT